MMFRMVIFQRELCFRVRILTMFGLNTWLALQQLRNEQGVWNGRSASPFLLNIH